MIGSIGKTLVILLLLGIAPLAAQVIIEQDSITTDSVNIFNQTQQVSSQKQGGVIAASMLVPGLGHQILGNQKRAFVYFGVEATLLFGAIFSHFYAERLFENARIDAFEFAGARGGEGADDTYWKNVGFYENSQGYNRIQRLNRTPQYAYVEPQLQWEWASTETFETYADKWQDATRLTVISSFFIGAMVLNRVVSFIDTRREVKFNQISLAPPRGAPAAVSSGMAVTLRF